MSKDYVVGTISVMNVKFPGDFKVTEGVPCLPLSINKDDTLVKFWDISDNPFIGKVVKNACVLFCKEDKIAELYGSRKNLFESYGFQNIDPWSCV